MSPPTIERCEAQARTDSTKLGGVLDLESPERPSVLDDCDLALEIDALGNERLELDRKSVV